jgi:hypothetical protein
VRFALQVWEVSGNRADPDAARLGDKLGEVGGRPRGLTVQPADVQESENGIHRFTISHLDPARCDRLALIVTRLDADEHLDPAGAYRIDVVSNAEVGS